MSAKPTLMKLARTSTDHARSGTGLAVTQASFLHMHFPTPA